ncbi:restriction endonuclease subunit S [Bathymodiolus thermophilus thioautotrophic gill symbiont]|uniref:Type I restriction modification DNA specificity domain-containing protein n=1 Tax=Bathymodiolus thermophilus thioautotrophic gill symbiont TaxID=2360 RepID=A0A1J5TSC9_9GAMM|nr:restriction endonuclease subunit S [Bathymodiolus thermophilus thioautotrophic gill symbiont]OIR23819.1 hypothetical protein BGC33_08275 [Bathymodiolus thermophilus thioautotrophic gill symbiont]
MSDLEKIQRNDLPSGWRVVELGNVISIIGGGTPKRNILDYWNGDIPWLTVKDFNNDLRHIDTVSESITKLGLEKSSTKILSNGQIIISARGTVGKLAQIIKPMAFNQSCYGINGKTNFLINDYLYYLLKFSIDGLKRISHGAVFDTITKNTFQHINSVIPPLSEQKAIANILGKLDDKIELNRQINQTLETMAQTLFKSWFVDFDPVIDNALKAGNPIPDSLKPQANKRKAIKSTLPQATQNLFPNRFVFNDILKKWIPEGWEVGNIGNIAKCISKGTTPKKIDTSDKECDIPFLKVRNISNFGDISDRLDLIPREVHNKQLKRSILKQDDVLVSIAGTIGRVAIVPQKLDNSNCNQAIAFIRLENIKEHKIFMHQWLISKFIQDKISLKVVQAVQANVSLKTIAELEIIFPKQKVLFEWNKKLAIIYESLNTNKEQVKTLTKLRDTLLPKLISGKIRV